MSPFTVCKLSSAWEVSMYVNVKSAIEISQDKIDFLGPQKLPKTMCSGCPQKLDIRKPDVKNRTCSKSGWKFAYRLRENCLKSLLY